MNVSNPPSESEYERLAVLFSLLAQPSRLQILQLIGQHEICVCHLKAALGLRQAYISQQLMGLRKVGYVTTRRQGRSIYYSLTDPRLLDIIEQAARMIDCSLDLPLAEDLVGCPVLTVSTKP